MFRHCRTIFILLIVVSALLHSGCLNPALTDVAAVQGPCCEHMTDGCRAETVGCCGDRLPAEGTTTVVTMRAEQAPQTGAVVVEMPSPTSKDLLLPSVLDAGHPAGQVPLRI